MYFEPSPPFVTQMAHVLGCDEYIGRYAGDLRNDFPIRADRMRFSDGTSPLPSSRILCPHCGFPMHAGNTWTEKVLLLTYEPKEQQ